MPDRYSINVKNNSGQQQKYAFFAERPQISGPIENQIWQVVFAASRAPGGAQVTASITSQYFAICGVTEGRPAEGVSVFVSNMKPVTLGSTTLPFKVRYEQPQFGPDLPNEASSGAFQINTDGSFSRQDAANKNYVIGVAAASGGGDSVPCATFTPQPNSQYKISPSNIYYVAAGDYSVGQFIDPRRINMKCTVDFGRLPKDVNIVHGEDGRLSVQA